MGHCTKGEGQTTGKGSKPTDFIGTGRSGVGSWIGLVKSLKDQELIGRVK
jgi:hypothetical protein